MAILKEGIMNGFSGKIGNIVGVIRKGQSIIRGYNPFVANPNTLDQQEQRAKFSLMISFLRPFNSLLRTSFKGMTGILSGMNVAMKLNTPEAIKGTYPAFEIDYPKVVLSKGNVGGFLNPAVISTVVGKLTVTWDNNSTEEGAYPTDCVGVAVYNPVTQKVSSVITQIVRTAGTATITLPDSFSGAEVQVYGFFTRKDLFSDSEHLAAVIVA